MADSIYKNPIALNQAAHKSLKVSRVKDFKFAKDVNSVIVSGDEFKESAKSFPLVFVRNDSDGEIMPIAILGLRKQGNLYINEEGAWKQGTYMPSFFRRYPFILADTQDASDGEYTVSIDTEFEGYDSEDGQPLFDDQGNPTEDLNKAVEFLRKYQANFIMTQEFIKKFEELDLFKEFYTDITLPAGEKLGFTGLLMVNEKALLELADDKALELYRRGYLAWAYAHLFSLTNFRYLAQLTIDQDQGKAGETAAE